MQEKKIIKVTDKIIHIKDIHSVGIIGDPGCEGLGTYNMKIYAGALEESAKDDITIVAGDLVPAGNKSYYRKIQDITEELAGNNVYVLRGNHDTGDYTEYFGEKNYALIAEKFTIIVLDNAMRVFDNEGLMLLSQVLAMDEVKQAVITFHIPVPNNFIKNSVTEEEFSRLKKAYNPWKDKVKYMVCGHVHSLFEDNVDGMPLICTGGGGAMIEDVSENIRACDVEHHIIHLYEEEGVLKHNVANLPDDCYNRERKDFVLKGQLEETVKGELMAHLKYLMFAERARRRGMDKIANLFDALAASEYYHARNFYSVLERPASFMESAGTFIPGEKFEYNYIYKTMEEYAGNHQSPLAKQAYQGAAAAEKEHARLLESVRDMESFTEENIYVCPICVYIMEGEDIPERCPVCGGPQRQFERFQAEQGKGDL